ncbi:MAG: GNAT family N-acetyltransferase, partial [Candidatus Micrarchaeota archaeon]
PIYAHDRYAHIGEIVVDAKYRRKGIGKALLEETEAWAKKKEMTSIALRVHTKNKGAYSAYKKAGFVGFSLKMVKKVK